MKAFTRTLGAAALLAMMGAGVAGAQTLRIGLAEDPDVLDPTMARTYVGRIVFMGMCDKLFDISQDLKIVPQLATEYSWSDDNKMLTLKLRPGVLFHDGEPMNAAAVKYSLERHLNMAGSFRKSEISVIDSVEAVDDLTVKVHLKAPFAPLLAQFTDRAGMIVSPKAAEAAGKDFGSKPVCAGPYKFTERVAQDRIVLERFDKYWNKDAYHFDKIVYIPITDSTVRLANLQSGGLDFIERAQPTDLPQIRANSRLKLASIAELGYQGITINTSNTDRSKTPLGQDARVRQAFEAAIDRSVITQVVYNGEFIPGNQWVPPGNPYYATDLPVPKRDVAKAKALLKEAGVTNPTITLMLSPNPDIQQIGQIIQAMTKEVGFDVKLQTTEFASALQQSVKGEFEAFILAWSGRTDPDGNINPFVSCKGGQNDGHYCNPDVEALLDKARTTYDVEQRKKFYADAMKITAKELPIIYLLHRNWFFAYSNKLNDFKPYPDGLVRLAGLKFN